MKLPLRAYWDLLAVYIRPQRGSFVLMSALLLGSIGLQIINPQIMRAFIDSALSGGAARQLLLAALAFIGIALLRQAVSVWVIYLSENVAWRATNALRGDLARHCLGLDMGFHNDHTPGELIERIDGDVSELANFFSQFFVLLLGNLLLLVGILAVLFWENLLVGVAFTIYAVAAVYTLNRVRDIAVPYEKARRQAEADLFGFIEEQLAGAEDVRSSGSVDFSLRELYRFQGAIMRHNRKAHYKGWIINLVMGGLITLGNILAVVVGYYLFTGNTITVGTVYLLIHYMNLLGDPLWMLTHEVQSFQIISACVERLTGLRQIKPRIDEGVSLGFPGARGSPLTALAAAPAAAFPSGAALPTKGSGLFGAPAYSTTAQRAAASAPTPGAFRASAALQPPSLAFEGVTFSYESALSDGRAGQNGGGAPTIADLSLDLPGGQVLGLLGRTGSGKTTLARLIFRLYEPQHGRILLDGQDIRAMPAAELRRRVAMVTQEVQLYRASVRDNLTFFDRRVSDEEILAAIQALELQDWFEALPKGLDSVLEGGSRSLSAGEGQLLAFTRVLLRDPGLVILDEASSRLDPATERRIERAVEHLLHGRTAIIIAHRLGTVQRADQIMILENGRVSEAGERRRLAADPDSHFYHLLQTGLEEVLA
jgi:ABC-type multidrug transport system fused ATPase/permease subunit